MTRRTGCLLSIAFAMFCLLSAALSAQPGRAKGQASTTEKKFLIVYVSRTNNTKAIAEMIREKVGGKLVALELQTAYPADYHATVQQVIRENETGYLPPLKTVIDQPDQYDVVFVGFPTWDMKLPPPMKSFLHQYGFRGKTIVPFNSNAGYGPGSTFDTVRELCPQSTVLQGFSTRGGVERDGELLAIKDVRAEEVRKAVDKWLRTIGMLKEGVSQPQ
jgi:flavodoxin